MRNELFCSTFSACLWITRDPGSGFVPSLWAKQKHADPGDLTVDLPAFPKACRDSSVLSIICGICSFCQAFRQIQTPMASEDRLLRRLIEISDQQQADQPRVGLEI